MTAWTEKLLAAYSRFLAGRGFLWCCHAVMALCVLYNCFQRPFHHWNDIRLARTFALLGQYDLYPSADSGPVTGAIYGPIGFLFYAPAALFPSPNGALFAAILLSVILGFLPVWLILRDKELGAPDQPHLAHLASLLFCAVFFHFYFASAEFGLWNVHVDAPALALSGLCCYFALRHGGRKGFSWRLGAAALAASLALWTKQTAAPIVAVPALYFLAIRNRTAVLRYSAAALALIAGIGAVAGALWGFDDIWLSVFLVPSSHSKDISQLFFAGAQVEDFMDVAALVVMVVLLVCASSRGGSRSAIGWRTWPLFLLSGFLMAPTAVLGRIKEGGTDNNYALVDYFLVIGVALLLLQTARAVDFAANRPLLRAVTLALGVLLSLQMIRAVPDLARLPGQAGAFYSDSPSQQAYNYARRNPGQTYFPWRPLPTLMAEQKLYHTAYGVHDRRRAGFPLSDLHLRRHLPAEMQYVAFDAFVDQEILERLPEFTCRADLAELPGWTVYARGADCW